MLICFFMLMVFAASMLTTVYKDATTMTIPNWTSLLVLAGFFIVVPFAWQGWALFGEHMASGLLMFAIGFAMFAFGWLGGGDAKLMAATSFWWTFSDLTMFIFYMTLAGGALGLFILFGRQFIPARVLTHPWMYKMIKDQTHMPYGLAIAFGAFMTLPQSAIFSFAATSL